MSFFCDDCGSLVPDKHRYHGDDVNKCIDCSGDRATAKHKRKNAVDGDAWGRGKRYG